EKKRDWEAMKRKFVYVCVCVYVYCYFNIKNQCSHQKDEELDSLYAEAVTLRKNGQYEKSLQLFEQLSEYCSGRMAAYHNQYGILLQHLAMKSAAAVSMNANQSQKLQQQREKDALLGKAEQQFQKAISIEPMNFIYLANYADLLRVMNRPQYAAEYYQKALKLNPTHPVTNSNYAYLLHMYLKQYSKACEHYQQCMEFNSHDFIVATNYALCLKELKEYDQAISLLKNFPTEDVMAQNLMKEIINAKIK
ncbi:TPR repeat-containing protein, partial [Reticulomyxa filosa]